LCSTKPTCSVGPICSRWKIERDSHIHRLREKGGRRFSGPQPLVEPLTVGMMARLGFVVVIVVFISRFVYFDYDDDNDNSSAIASLTTRSYPAFVSPSPYHCPQSSFSRHIWLMD